MMMYEYEAWENEDAISVTRDGRPTGAETVSQLRPLNVWDICSLPAGTTATFVRVGGELHVVRDTVVRPR